METNQLHLNKTIKDLIKGKKLICLVDGEHYPTVTKGALHLLHKEGGKIVAILFLGGTEKIKNALEELKDNKLNYKMYLSKNKKDLYVQLIYIIKENKSEIVIDLSDEPVVDYHIRNKIATVVLKQKNIYLGSDFAYFPPEEQKILTKPSLAIISTGKRIGKTATGVTIARILKQKGFNPIVICMGRGGPENPEYINADKIDLNKDFLLDIAKKGQHAASDYWENAFLAHVPTIGCRRCGGGFAGNLFFSNVIAGAELANKLDYKFVVIEGSGTTIPPVKTNIKILLIGAGQPLWKIFDYFGFYRIMLADMILITMCEYPIASPKKVNRILQGVKKINPDIKVIPTIFRPEPCKDISNKKIFFATTANKEILNILVPFIEKNYNCKIIASSNNLSNRTKLKEELDKNLSRCDILLTEIKAASIDLAAKTADDYGLETIFYHNKVKIIGKEERSFGELILNLCNKYNN